VKKLLILVFFIPILSGCWNYREINDLAIVTGFAVEEVDNDIKISAQIMRIQKSIGQDQLSQEMSYVLEATGKTFYEALRKITLRSPKRLYISHIKIFIIDEKIARKSIQELIDYPIRETEFRAEFYIFVSKDTKASDILKVVTPLKAFSSNAIEDYIEISSEILGKNQIITYTDFLHNYMEEGLENVVNGLYIKGDVKQGENIDDLKKTNIDAIIYLGNIGVFKNDKLLGWLTEDESYGYNFITNKIDTAIINIPCDKDKYIAVEILSSTSSIKTKIKDEKASGSVKVKGYGLIGEVNCPIDLNDEKVIEKIREDTNSYVKKLIEDTITSVQQKYKSDIFGFGQQVHKKEYKTWHKVKKNWDNIFENMGITVDVNYELPEEGTIIRVLKDKD